MESIACIIAGVGLIASGLALFRLRQPNWQDEGDLSDQNRPAIEWWSNLQSFVRNANNILLILMGLMIFASSFFPHGQGSKSDDRTWMFMWIAILGLVLICIFLAMVDAMSSLAGYKRALPEAARRSFSDPKLKNSSLKTADLPETLPE